MTYTPGILEMLAWLIGFDPETAKSEPVAEDDRDRRAFVDEMLMRNPSAFSSEQDVANMMHHFPGRF